MKSNSSLMTDLSRLIFLMLESDSVNILFGSWFVFFVFREIVIHREMTVQF